VLDKVHARFLVSSETQETINQLETSLASLRDNTKKKVEPLMESVTNIRDCVETLHAVQYIT